MTLRRNRLILIWDRLSDKQRELIPIAYYNEDKRLELCRIDNEILKIKRELYRHEI